MGPRLISRGEFGCPRISMHRASFNGAPWRVGVPILLRLAVNRFNGATADQPWRGSYLLE